MFEVDQNTASRLSAVKESQYIVSPDGRVLGHYVPVEGGFTVKDFEPRISEEEMCRRAEAFDGITTTELLARLKDRERN